MDEATESAFRRALEAEITAFSIRERAQGGAFIPLRVKKWDAKRGGWVLTPTGSNPHLNGSRLIQLVDRIQIGAHRFQAIWNTDLPRLATLCAKISGSGDAKALVEDETLGIITTNEWAQDLQGQVSFVSVQQEEGSNNRLIWFEATEQIVQLIQNEGGVISFGSDSATIQNNRNRVKRGVNITYRLQK